MSIKELLLLEKELERLRKGPPGLELAAVLIELASATHPSDPLRSEAFAYEALDLAENLVDKEAALDFCLESLSLTRKLNFKDTEIQCLKNISYLYEAKGDLQQALNCSMELKLLVEEYLDGKSKDKIAMLKLQFDTVKKEKETEICRLRNVELSEKNDQLRKALAHVKRLKGLLPVCSYCKKVRDDDGYWQQIDLYLSEHSDAKFSQGICPECYTKFYGKVYTKKRE